MSLCSYFLVSDINKHVKIKINTLKGYQFPDELDVKSTPNYSNITISRSAELYVTCEIWSRGISLGGPSSTTYKCFSSQSSQQISPLSSTTLHGVPTIKWGEWITFPVKYRDLGPTSRLVLTVWSITPPKPVPPSSLNHIPTTSIPTSALVSALPSQPISQSLDTCQAVPLGGTCLPMFNKKGVLKLGKRTLFLHNGRAGEDNMRTTPYKVDYEKSMEAMELMKLEKMICKYDQHELPTVKWLDKLSLRKIEMMQTKENTIYPSEQGKMYLTVDFPHFKHPVVYHQKPCNVAPPEILSYQDHERIMILYDPASTSENPIENKYHKLARSSKGIADRDLKPQITERKAIQAILSSPNKRLTVGEKELLWKFRFSLTEDKRALTKFLRCVNWFDANETKQALDLLQEWAAIDIADALELLSGYFTNEGVRTYAVKQLQRADNEELSGYLLQLVQALRYETIYPSVLSEFLINRASQNFQLTNFFYWFLSTEIHDPRKSSMYTRVVQDFLDTLKHRNNDTITWEKQLLSAGDLVKNLIALGNESKINRSKIDKRIDRMRYLLTEGDFRSMRRFNTPVRMPVRPEIEVTGLIGEESTMFKSALAPILAAFTTPNGPHYKVLFKSGDDLRQDQLIIQMINLMDSLLKKVKLDLQLTPYRVLATSAEDGFVEFVPSSHTLTSVLDKYDKDIRKFIQVHNPTDVAFRKALDVFVKSCAGYCVITYILGIGDRHLDNVLLTTSGHLFHIDFGFIFGRDPKPFPPPMKFCKEMVEAMGGSQSAHYHDFRRYCVSAFNILRQHASLIINLLSLMGDANIPDLAIDVERNLLKVQEKFRLDLADEEAGHFLLGLLDQSVSALFPVMMEKIHKWALYWK